MTGAFVCPGVGTGAGGVPGPPVPGGVVGFPVGGDVVGLPVGLPVGLLVGLLVGLADPVGPAVGLPVGFPVGLPDGLPVEVGLASPPGAAQVAAAMLIVAASLPAPAVSFTASR